MSATTLAFSRVCRSTAFTRYATRSLGTEALASPDSTSATIPPVDSATTRSTSNNRSRTQYGKNKIVPQNYAVYVRPWDEIGGMPALLAMVRGLEKRFGRVREFRVARDSDVPSHYLGYFIAEFAEEEAYRRVPENGTHIKVQVPVSSRDRPGGVGLDELQGLLQAEQWDPDYDVPSKAINPFPTPEVAEQRPTRIVELVVQRSEKNKIEEVYRRPMQQSQRFGIAFYRWGGFYQPPDGEGGLRPAMHAALSKWRDVAAAKATSQPQRSRDSTPAQDTESTVENADTPSPEVVDPHYNKHHGAESSHNAADPSRGPDTTLSATESSSDVLSEPSSPAIETAAPSNSANDMTIPVQDASAGPSQSAASTDTTAPETPRPARLSQRERILMLARQHAKTPLPDQAAEEQKEAEAKQVAEEAQKEKEKNRGALLDALKKMMGSGW
ncbi:hypothetical protein C8Q73DRAFT_710214 [Cubamyces lactineus]|nr:hypothetical protein C8Q73DRAFT_710214 [Cubamyces lactineus]